MALRRMLPLLLVGVLLLASSGAAWFTGAAWAAGGTPPRPRGPGGVTTPPPNSLNLLSGRANPSAASTLAGTGFTYQGELTSGGSPVNATCSLQFSLFDASSAGHQLGSPQTVNGVVVAAGRFTVTLNDSGQFGASAFDGEARWLAIGVKCPPDSGFTPLLPRQPLTAAPLALALPGMRTQVLGADVNVIGGPLSNTIGANLHADVIAGGGSVDYPNTISGPLTGYASIGGGGGNLVDGEGSAIGGGESNTVTGTQSFVGGGSQNVAVGNVATVGGGEGNLAQADGETIAGGYQNKATSNYEAIGGGYHNTAIGSYATIAGGYQNNTTNVYEAIGGGYQNNASGDTATIAGGNLNTASGTGAFVGGGGWDGANNGGNTAAGAVSTVGGGLSNTAFNTAATIAGGFNNGVTGDYGTIGGGITNTVTSFFGTIGGGKNNSAGSSDSATVAGGQNNSAGGYAATVPGGDSNSAAGDESFAAGAHAHADNEGAFVWADATGGTLTSTQNNQFLVRASGGITLYTNSGASSGAALYSGSGSWNNLSDRNMKANFDAVDGLQVLDALAGIPIETWNYKTQATAIRHMGPMAQDFHAAFGVGENDTTISTVDAQGVALAAIQGLYSLVQQQDKQISTLQAANASQQDDIAALNARVTRLENGAEQPAAGTAIPSSALPWLLLIGLGLLNVGGVAGYLVKKGRNA